MKCGVFAKPKQAVERVHMQFCKTNIGLQKTTQNDFVYGELGRINYVTKNITSLQNIGSKF